VLILLVKFSLLPTVWLRNVRLSNREFHRQDEFGLKDTM